MAILNSKIIDVTEKADFETIVSEIENWLPPYASLEGKRVVVTVETCTGGRLGKLTATQKLESLVAENAQGEKAAWEKYDYKFLFTIRSYWWKGKQIYLTVAEALAIYRVVVLQDHTVRGELTYLLRNMRKRLGKEFLVEEVPNRVMKKEFV